MPTVAARHERSHESHEAEQQPQQSGASQNVQVLVVWQLRFQGVVRVAVVHHALHFHRQIARANAQPSGFPPHLQPDRERDKPLRIRVLRARVFLVLLPVVAHIADALLQAGYRFQRHERHSHRQRDGSHTGRKVLCERQLQPGVVDRQDGDRQTHRTIHLHLLSQWDPDRPELGQHPDEAEITLHHANPGEF